MLLVFIAPRHRVSTYSLLQSVVTTCVIWFRWCVPRSSVVKTRDSAGVFGPEGSGSKPDTIPVPDVLSCEGIPTVP